MNSSIRFSELSTFFNRKRMLNVSFGFILGLTIGYFLKDIFLWRRKEEGYLYEILKEIMNIKSELKKLKSKVRKINEIKTDTVDRNFNVEMDEFEDAQSSLDEIESFYSFAEDYTTELDSFVKELDEMLLDTSVENYSRCYYLCESEFWKFQDRGEFMWRYAKIAYNSTLESDMDTENRNRRIFAAFNNALIAVKKLPKSSDAHKWLGILYGVTGMLSDTNKRILNGYKFKEHIDLCIRLNPNDAYAYLLRGRFCYQVSNLAFYERKLASILFTTPPVATMEEALESFAKCEELAPNKYGENHYFLSLCYQYFGDYVQSQQYMESAKSLPVKDVEIKSKLQNS